MYAALIYPEHALKNTHVILVDTTHPPLTKKFKLPPLKIQSVHEYSYTDVKKGTVKVEVAHHGGIEAGASTRWSFTTKDQKYTSWVKEADFVAHPWEGYKCKPCALDDKAKPQGKTGRMFKSQMAAVTAFRKVVLESARDWSLRESNIQRKRDAAVIIKPEHPATKKMSVTTKGWMTKKHPPPIQTPLAIRKVLVEHFNKRNPYMSPEESRKKLLMMDEYRNDIFVEYFMTPARIKSFFGRLKKYKKDKRIADETNLTDEAAGTETSAGENSYKDLQTNDALRLEIRSRNLVVHRLSSMKKADLIAVLRQNDIDRGEGCGDGEAEDACDVEYAIEESGKGALDPESSAFDGVQDMKESCDGDDGPEVLMDALMQADDGNDYVVEVEGA